MDTSLVSGCGFCGKRDMRTVIDFGKVALAGAFLKPTGFATEQKFPMTLVFCDDCALLQVAEHVAPSTIFSSGYFYFSSSIGTLKQHFENYAKEVQHLLADAKQDLIVEIGCNDGVLLEPLVQLGCKRLIGIDPSSNVLAKTESSVPILINDFFSPKSAAKIKALHGHARLILANNVFAHISDIKGFVSGVVDLLDEQGVFVFEVHYIRHLIEGHQYDMIYHEHLYNYSLISLDRFFRKSGLEIFDIKEIPIHAGSMRYYVKRTTNKGLTISPAVDRLRQEELAHGYQDFDTFIDYGRRIGATRDILVNTLHKLTVQEGKKIAGYGASGRANTVLQFCQLASSPLIKFIVDDAPAKQGYFTPGTHIEIKDRSALSDEHPDYVVCFAWSFMDEIIARNQEYLNRGGVFIVPLPQPHFLKKNALGDIVKIPCADLDGNDLL